MSDQENRFPENPESPDAATAPVEYSKKAEELTFEPLTVMHIPISVAITPAQINSGGQVTCVISFSGVNSGEPFWVNCSNPGALNFPVPINGSGFVIGSPAWPCQIGVTASTLQLSITAKAVSSVLVQISSYKNAGDAPTALSTLPIGPF